MKTVDFKTSEAAAIDSGAMEAETISKNGRSLKSHMSKRNILKFVFALFVVATLGMGLSACGNANAQGGNSNASARWEYKIVSIRYEEDASQNGLNDLGKEGWELVTTFQDAHCCSAMFTFKRRLP